RCCTHLLEMRFPAPSTRGAGPVGIRPEDHNLTRVELSRLRKTQPEVRIRRFERRMNNLWKIVQAHLRMAPVRMRLRLQIQQLEELREQTRVLQEAAQRLSKEITVRVERSRDVVASRSAQPSKNQSSSSQRLLALGSRGHWP